MRRGVININDVAAYTALVIIILLFLGLFLLEKERISDAAGEDAIEEALMARHAGLALETWLQSPWGQGRMADAVRECIGDCPYNQSTINLFGRFCRSFVVQLERDGTRVRLGEGITDELTVAGRNYEEWWLDPDAKLGGLPPFQRLFLRDPRASLLKAQQQLPDGITVTMLCVERGGVILS